MSGLSDVRTEEDLAAYVEEHDTAEDFAQMEPVDAGRFRVRHRTQTAVRVRIPQALLLRLREVAAKRGTSLDELLAEWVSERAEQELAA